MWWALRSIVGIFLAYFYFLFENRYLADLLAVYLISGVRVLVQTFEYKLHGFGIGFVGQINPIYLLYEDFERLNQEVVAEDEDASLLVPSFVRI